MLTRPPVPITTGREQLDRKLIFGIVSFRRKPRCCRGLPMQVPLDLLEEAEEELFEALRV